MPRLIGIGGGSGSGKTTIVRKLAEAGGEFLVIPQDNYYRSAAHVHNENITAFNFDHPSAFDTELLCDHLRRLKAGEAVDMPTYDFVHHCRTDQTIRVGPSPLIVLEGIMVFFDRELRDLMDLKLFVDTPDDIRFIRRLKRDISQRGRTVDSVIQQYQEVVRPGHYEFIEPTKAYADLIIPESGLNERNLEVLGGFIARILDQPG